MLEKVKNCTEKGDFDKLLQFALAEWENIAPNYTEYFRKQWVDGVLNIWSRSQVLAGIPISSSGLEGHHACIKKL